MKNWNRFSNELEQNAGVDISHCYQCGKCTAGCVLAEEMDYAPSYIMRLLQTGNEENLHRVLSSDAIWICLSCENCATRCPKEVDIPKVMDYLRVKSQETGCINKKSQPVVAFHSSFLDSVKRTGRLYEVGLVAGFKLRTFRLTQDLNIAPVMYMKGKLNLLPETIKDTKRMQRIFARTMNRLNKDKK